MARPKKPLQVILANNNSSHLSKKEIKERLETEIKAPCNNIKAPSYLPDELKQEFYKISKKLVDIGIMSNLDETALARFLVSEFQYQQMTKKMLKTKDTTNEYLCYAGLQDRYFKRTRVAAGDLGLTISSRGKIVLL